MSHFILFFILVLILEIVEARRFDCFRCLSARGSCKVKFINSLSKRCFFEVESAKSDRVFPSLGSGQFSFDKEAAKAMCLEFGARLPWFGLGSEEEDGHRGAFYGIASDLDEDGGPVAIMLNHKIVAAVKDGPISFEYDPFVGEDPVDAYKGETNASDAFKEGKVWTDAQPGAVTFYVPGLGKFMSSMMDEGIFFKPRMVCCQDKVMAQIPEKVSLPTTGHSTTKSTTRKTTARVTTTPTTATRTTTTASKGEPVQEGGSSKPGSTKPPAGPGGGGDAKETYAVVLTMGVVSAFLLM